VTAPSYPVQLRLAGRRCLVVGAGAVAARKVDGLRRAGAVITVVAPEAVPEIAEAHDLSWHERAYVRGEAASYALVVTATDSTEVNSQVFRDAEAAGIFVNAADDNEHCSFTLPAVARRGRIQISVATDGRSPAIARWLRRRLEDSLDEQIDALVEMAADTRAELRDRTGTAEVDGWDDGLDAAQRHLADGDPVAAREALRRSVGLGLLDEVAS